VREGKERCKNTISMQSEPGSRVYAHVSFGLRDVGQQWTDYADQGRGVALSRTPSALLFSQWQEAARQPHSQFFMERETAF
jgi:hypothetical protein